MVFKLGVKRKEYRRGQMMTKNRIYWILTAGMALSPALQMCFFINIISHYEL